MKVNWFFAVGCDDGKGALRHWLLAVGAQPKGTRRSGSN
jgi:hypothetical protein